MIQPDRSISSRAREDGLQDLLLAVQSVVVESELGVDTDNYKHEDSATISSICEALTSVILSLGNWVQLDLRINWIIWLAIAARGST